VGVVGVGWLPLQCPDPRTDHGLIIGILVTSCVGFIITALACFLWRRKHAPIKKFPPNMKTLLIIFPPAAVIAILGAIILYNARTINLGCIDELPYFHTYVIGCIALSCGGAIVMITLFYLAALIGFNKRKTEDDPHPYNNDERADVKDGHVNITN